MNRRERNTNTEVAPEVTASTTDTPTEPAAEAKRNPRPQIDTGPVTVEILDEDASFGGRASKLDTDPVAVAVRDAVDGKVNVLRGEPDKMAGIESIARRAGVRYNRGLRFDKRQAAEGILKFVTGEKRKTRPSKKDAADKAE